MCHLTPLFMILWMHCGKRHRKNMVVLKIVCKWFHWLLPNTQKNASERKICSQVQPICLQSFIIYVNLTSRWCKTNYTCVTNVRWNLLISTLTIGCLSGLHLATQPWTSSHPHHFFFFPFFFVYSVMPVSQLLCEWAGAKRKGGKVGCSNIHQQPTQNYSMWWYKSYLIMW